MARIQEYSRQVGAPNVVDMAKAPTSIGYGQAGEAIGGAVNNAMSAYDKVQTQKEEYQVKLDLLEDQTTFELNEKNRLQNTPPDGKGYTESVSKEWDTIKANRLKNASSLRQERMYEMNYASLKASKLQAASSQESNMFARHNATVSEQAVNAQANLIRSNPAKLEDSLKSVNGLIDAMPGLDPSKKEEFRAKQIQTLYDSALDGTVTNLVSKPQVTSGEINGMLAKLKDPKNPYQQYVSKERYDQSLSKLQSMSKVASDQEAFNSKVEFEDEMKRITDVNLNFNPNTYKTKFTDDFIKSSNFSPKQKEDMLRTRNEAWAVAMKQYDMRNMSFQDAAKSISPAEYQKKVAADPSKYHIYRAEQEAATKALKQMQDSYKTDSIAYVKKYDGVGDYINNFSQKMDQGKASPEEVNDYISKVKSMQMQIDPYSPTRIVSKDETDKLKYLLSTAGMTENGASLAIQTLSQEANKWGPNWEEVVGDYRKDNAMTGQEAVASTLLNDPAKRGVAEALLKSSRIPEDQLNKTYGKMNKEDLIKNSSAALQGYIRSLVGTENGTQIGSDYVDSVVKLTQFYGGSKSPEQVAHEVVNDQYHFVESGGRSLRVPKAIEVVKINPSTNRREVQRIAGPSPRMVDRASDAVMSNIKNYDIIPPMSDLKYEDAQKQYKNSIYELGYVANDGDTGLRMMDAANHQVFVRDGNKQRPLKWTWQELQSESVSKEIRTPRGY